MMMQKKKMMMMLTQQTGNNVEIYTDTVTLDSQSSTIAIQPKQGVKPLAAWICSLEEISYGADAQQISVAAGYIDFPRVIDMSRSSYVPNEYISFILQTRTNQAGATFNNVGNSARIDNDGTITFGVLSTSGYLYAAGTYRWVAIYGDSYPAS